MELFRYFIKLLKNNSLIVLAILILASCQKEDISVSGSEIVGNWVFDRSQDTLYIYKRVLELPENDYGMSIQFNNIYFERANSGWCGTPPIVFSNYPGKWFLNDSILKVNYRNWSGNVNNKWKVTSVNSSQMKLVKIQ